MRTELRAQLEHDVFSTVWSDGVFFAGGYPLEALEKAVGESDFAVAIAQPDDVVRSRRKCNQRFGITCCLNSGFSWVSLRGTAPFLFILRSLISRLPSDLHGLTLLSYRAGFAAGPSRSPKACLRRYPEDREASRRQNALEAEYPASQSREDHLLFGGRRFVLKSDVPGGRTLQ